MVKLNEKQLKKELKILNNPTINQLPILYGISNLKVLIEFALMAKKIINGGIYEKPHKIIDKYWGGK